jgi:tetratricopeptide (TPR) repeat protein
MWERVTQVAAGSNHSVGLCADGTVIATGNNNKGQCNVDEWKDIVAVAADKFATFGLRIDGTVVAEGFEGKEYKNWKDVFAICAQNGYLVAAKTDGTVVCEPADLKFSKTQLNMFKDTAADVQVKILSTAKELTQKDFNPFAAKLLKTVVNPKDKELYAMCENKQIPIDEIIYVKAGQLKDEGLSDAAKAAYQMLGDYKDSAQLMLICNVGVVEKAYKEAIECIKKGDYYTANYHLAKHAEYTDTTPELEAIKAEYIIAAYNKGSEAMDRQTFKIAKNIVATADSVEAKTDDKAIIEKIAESKFSFKAVAYEKASKAMEDEMYYDNAKELLTMIGDFKDSKELLAKCEKGLKERAVKEKALEEAIQKGKLEAEKKARETELKAQLEQLNEDLNNVPKFLGIPDKRKKAQIEEQIKIIQSEIDKLG